MPSDKSILTPKIVPFFRCSGKHVVKIAARRSRSLAITDTNDVYEWGFVGSDSMQFKKLFTLPGPCKEVEIGLEFNIFILENGSVYFSGVIT